MAEPQQVSLREKYLSIRETRHHKNKVLNYLKIIIKELKRRSKYHDLSKMKSPELDIFAMNCGTLKKMTYMSEEYKKNLERIRPALLHHYHFNRHHPEHFPNGVSDMNLIDLTEMLADWMASVLRHEDGNIFTSIEKSKERFGISDELTQILMNTVIYLLDDKNSWK